MSEPKGIVEPNSRAEVSERRQSEILQIGDEGGDGPEASLPRPDLLVT